jgi:uncharacterized protein (TIGR02646 family)
MKDDPHCGGRRSYGEIKRTLVRAQRCLCAFCEMRIADGTDDAAIDARKDEQRVEHFHPKDDTAGPLNWALHWPNLWSVCLGGSKRPVAGTAVNPATYMEPLPENLSCDAFKDRQMREGRLPASPEGWVLAPDEVPAFPILFTFAPDGAPEPHAANCASVTLANNKHRDTLTMVAKTIEHLNLGCARLNRNRRIAKARLEKQIAQLRQRTPGAPARHVLTSLARRLFPQQLASPWPEFFTLIRWRLGATAEEQLRAIRFAV